MSRKLTTRKTETCVGRGAEQTLLVYSSPPRWSVFLFVVTLTRSEYKVGGYQGIDGPDSLTSLS